MIFFPGLPSCRHDLGAGPVELLGWSWRRVVQFVYCWILLDKKYSLIYKLKPGPRKQYILYNYIISKHIIFFDCLILFVHLSIQFNDSHGGKNTGKQRKKQGTSRGAYASETSEGYISANLPTSQCAPELGMAGWEGLASAYDETPWSLTDLGYLPPRMTEKCVMVGKKHRQ